MFRQLIIAGFLTVLASAAPGFAGAEPQARELALPSAGVGAGANPPPGVAASTTATVTDQYRIGADDVLEVVVFQVPELSRTVQVDSTGQFTLPLVGRVPAAGHTADEVAASLTEKLSGRYLKDPLITVVVKQAVSQRVTVQGAVVKPGIYSLSGPTSLLQALALANGPDLRIANERKVAVFRNVDGARRAQLFDLVKIRDGKADDPPVRPDDIIIVDTSGARSFFAYFGSSLSILNLLTLF